MLTGERIYNLEKLFNYREGFTRADDVIPERFYEEPLTVGDKKGAVLTREQFNTMMDEYYTKRGWSLKTSEPSQAKLEGLGLILAVDRFLDMCRTTVNVWSDSCGAVTIAKTEGETLKV